MGIERFGDVRSWQEARLLVADIYRFLQPCRDYGFRDQIQRAAVSIMTNIAEGFERGGNKEFIYFLTIARGSAAEVKSLGYAGLDIGHISSDQFKDIETKTNQIRSVGC
jgi:four helix bundle protein